MINKKAVDYVRTLREKGISDDLIKKKLIKSGYPPEYVEKIYKNLNPNHFFIYLLIFIAVLILGFAGYTLIYNDKAANVDKTTNPDVPIVEDLNDSDVPLIEKPTDPLEYGVECELEDDLYDCYLEVGIHVGQHLTPTKAINKCSNVEKDYKQSCFLGLGMGFAYANSSSESYCNLVPDESKGHCLGGFESVK